MSGESSAADALLVWLRQFGIDEAKTGLALWGERPEERGLRTTTDWHKAAQRTDQTTEPCARCAQSNRDAASEIDATESGPIVCECFPISTLSVSPVLSIPSALLITPRKVRASALVRHLLNAEHVDRASDSELLSLFLVHQHRLGDRSKWLPYIASLPRSYTSVEWWHANELATCQSPRLEEQARQQRAELQREWSRVCKWMSAKDPSLVAHSLAVDSATAADADFLPLHWTGSVPVHACLASFAACSATTMCSLPTLAEYQWAWSSVSTRSCFLPPLHSSASEVGANKPTSHSTANATTTSASTPSTRRDASCLIPFLDMLNHSSAVHMDCRLTPTDYQLWMVRPSPLRLHAGSELFISYGAHSNGTLLGRYGFTLLDNQHESLKLRLSDVEAFLVAPQQLMAVEHHAALKAPWPTPPPTDSSLHAAAFLSCSCARQYDLALGLSALPRYARALPGFGPAPAWQLSLLKACGLYAMCDQLQAPAASRGAVTFTLHCCAVPFDLTTYIRIRVLSLDEARRAAATGSTVPSRPSSSSKPSLVASAAAAASSYASGLSASDVTAISSQLLNEDSPYLSIGHRLLSQRVLVELVSSCLLSASGLGGSSLQEDLACWYDRSDASYARQQALILRLTQKRLCHILLAHALGDLA